jgi:hypothetical protein
MVAYRQEILKAQAIGGLEAALALRVKQRAGARGRQHLEERGEAWRERGRSDNSLSEEKQSMSEEGRSRSWMSEEKQSTSEEGRSGSSMSEEEQSMGSEVHLSAGSAQLEERRTERGGHFYVCMVCTGGSP